MIFFLLNWPLWQGRAHFVGDTGDGIAAFKFLSLPVRYWNWIEAAGQPFWMDLAIFRLQDPLVWLFAFPLKWLPLATLTAFQIFILVEFCAFGLGVDLLARSLGLRARTAQVTAFLALFGGLGAGMYHQFGMFYVALPFVYGLWCAVRLAQTGRGRYLAGAGLVLIYGSLSYHLLMLAPFFAGLAAWQFRPLWRGLRENLAGLAIVLLGALLATFSAYTALHHPGQIPALRNTFYMTLLDERGNKEADQYYAAGNLFEASLLSEAEACRTTAACATYDPARLLTFLLPGRAETGEAIGFIGRIGILLAIFGAVAARRRRLPRACLAVFAGALLLSAGHRGWLWPIVQSVLPGFFLIRHTHFYLAILSLAAIGLAGVGLETISDRRARALLLGLILAEGLQFHFAFTLPHAVPTAAVQREMISEPLITELTSRELRAYNPFQAPRTAVGTALGIPTAIEAIDRASSAFIAKDKEIRVLGFITPFVLAETLRARLTLSSRREDFGRAFGVKPYGVLSGVTMADGVNPRVTIVGNNLVSTLVSKTETRAYLAIPYGQIATIDIDGAAVPFKKERGFGLAFTVPPGAHTLTVKPEGATAFQVLALYYSGAFLIWGYLALSLLVREIRPLGYPEPAPFFGDPSPSYSGS